MAANILVSYDNITAPFPDVQTLLAKTREAAGQKVSDPAKADARVASVATALQALQAEQGKYPKVMHTPRDQMGSLLQSHIARQAAQNNKLDQLILKGISFIFEGLEVKFSQADWFEWMRAFSLGSMTLCRRIFLQLPMSLSRFQIISGWR